MEFEWWGSGEAVDLQNAAVESQNKAVNLQNEAVEKIGIVSVCIFLHKTGKLCYNTKGSLVWLSR